MSRDAVTIGAAQNEGAVLRVMVVEDHPVMREALGMILRRAGHEVVEVDSGERAVELVGSVRPDVVLMDVELPQMTGIEATARVLECSPATRVLVLSVHSGVGMVRSALGAGASGYLDKTNSADTIVDAVRRVADGVAVIAPDYLAAQVVGVNPVRLSTREREVLALMATGMTSRQISAKLAISVSTVYNHLDRIRAKFGVRNRVELTRAALEIGLGRHPGGD